MKTNETLTQMISQLSEKKTIKREIESDIREIKAIIQSELTPEMIEDIQTQNHNAHNTIETLKPIIQIISQNYRIR